MATAIEYGLLAALVVVGAGTAISKFSPDLHKKHSAAKMTPVDQPTNSPVTSSTLVEHLTPSPDYTVFVDKETGCRYFQNYVGTLSIKYTAQGMPDCPGIPIVNLQK